jgi:WD40 repeat protein
MAISADGRQVLASALDAVGTVRTFQVGSGIEEGQAVNARPEPGCDSGRQQIRGSPSPQFPVYSMALGPDGRSLAFQQGKCLVVRDMPTARTVAVLRQFNGGSSTGPAFVFRPDGRLVVLNSDQAAVGPGPARVQIWDWRTQRIVAEVPTPSFATASERGLAHVVISPGGGCVATIGGTPAMVSIWGGGLQGEPGSLPVPPDTRDIALSADCTRLASVSSDTTVRIWDVHRREQLLVLIDDDQHEVGLVFTQDGRLIARRSSGGYTIWESVRRQ